MGVNDLGFGVLFLTQEHDFSYMEQLHAFATTRERTLSAARNSFLRERVRSPSRLSRVDFKEL